MHVAPVPSVSRPWLIAAALVACLGVLVPVGGHLGRAVLAHIDVLHPGIGALKVIEPPEPFEGRWRPVEIEGEAVELASAEREPFLILSTGDHHVTGFTGCNRITGSYETEGSSLRLGPLATTRRACLPGPAALEARFLSALRATAKFAVQGRTLELRDEAGTLLMVLEERNLG